VIVSCNKLLKKYPTNNLLKVCPPNVIFLQVLIPLQALKSLALVRTQKIEDAIVLCDEILAAHPTDEAVLNLMMHSLKTLGRSENIQLVQRSLLLTYRTSLDKDMVTMYEEAYKRQPTNEELGAQTFFAQVRTGNWKNAQQVCTNTKLVLTCAFIYMIYADCYQNAQAVPGRSLPVLEHYMRDITS
jgi:N-terminal acetyltransferase B complex non-catalytic subunit